MAVSLSKYEALAAVVEHGSLTRAAETLRCTQSNLSHSLDSLEKELASRWSSAGEAA